MRSGLFFVPFAVFNSRKCPVDRLWCMLKANVVVLQFLLLTAIFGQSGHHIVLTNDHLSVSLGNHVGVLEDSLNQYADFNEILAAPDDAFQLGDEPIINFDFTASRYWLRFSVTNQSDFTHFITEFGRPVTNIAEYFELENGDLIHHFISGDDYAYDEKEILHPKNIFPLEMRKGATKTFYVKLESDGELLFTPVFFHERMVFFAQDFKDQFKNGFYYGLIALVVIIYFFFFVFLRDKAYLFYILYAFSQGVLQFSLDGYSHHHFVPQGGYLASHILLVFAGLTVIFLLTYVNNFLRLKDHSKKIWRVFNISRFLMGAIIVLSLIPGEPYELSFPIINGASLFSVLLAAYSIIRLRVKGVKVDFFFALAFMILIVGGVVFILGNLSIVGDKIISLGALKISSALEFVVLSISMSNKYGKLQREKEEAQRLAFENLQEKNQLMDESNVRLEKQVRERTHEIELQKEALGKSREEILSSIKYAQRIQQAILPSDEDVRQLLPESFIFYRPKDVVSGDFYFIESTKTSAESPVEYVIFAAVDCTGHGVPGAFMSIVGNNLLTQSLTEESVNSPGEALAFLNVGVHNTLRQNIEGKNVRDGMDIAMCSVNIEAKKLIFSGAKNPLYIIRKKEHVKVDELPTDLLISSETERLVLMQIKGDKQAIGYSFQDFKPYQNHYIDLFEGDEILVFTDGYADQFGGEEEKKYNYKRFRDLLLSIYAVPMAEKNSYLEKEFDNWRGANEQIDDVLVIGVKI